MAHVTVSPRRSPGNAGFLYGTTSTLSFQSSTFTGWQTIPADFNVHALSALLSPLLSGKIYYFRLVFVNRINRSYHYGHELSVATPASVTTTQAATAITSSSAMEHGSVPTRRSSDLAGFLYGTTSTLSFQSSTFTGWQTIPADFNVHALSALLSPLLSGKIYYFQLVF